jgi:RNA polymerase sigma-70 factor, ECF subfamily
VTDERPVDDVERRIDDPERRIDDPERRIDDDQLLATYADTSRPTADRQQAFRVLERRYRRRIFAVCVRVLGDPSDAEDAVQETLLKLARSAEGFRGDAQVSTWVYRIARNVCTDRVRYDARRPSVPVEDPALLERRFDDDGSDLVAVGDQLARAMDRLDDLSRRLLLLVAVDDLSYADAAEVCDLPVGTVKSRIARARHQLGLLLREDDEVEGPGPAASATPIVDAPGQDGPRPRGPPTPS